MTKRLRLKEAAAEAGVSVSTLSAWLKVGLVHYRVGAKADGRSGRIEIDPADLKAFVEGMKCVGGGTVPPPNKVPKAEPYVCRHLKQKKIRTSPAPDPVSS